MFILFLLHNCLFTFNVSICFLIFFESDPPWFKKIISFFFEVNTFQKASLSGSFREISHFNYVFCLPYTFSFLHRVFFDSFLLSLSDPQTCFVLASIVFKFNLEPIFKIRPLDIEVWFSYFSYFEALAILGPHSHVVTTCWNQTGSHSHPKLTDLIMPCHPLLYLTRLLCLFHLSAQVDFRFFELCLYNQVGTEVISLRKF